MSEIADAVTGTVNDLFGADAAEPQVPNSEGEAAAPKAQDAAPEFDFNPAVPEDLEELLEAPDVDDPEEVEEYVASDEYQDPEELARELAKARKQIAYAEDQRVKASRKNWEAEARKHFPLAQPETIDAKSRRAFLREAKAQHERTFTLVKPVVESYEARSAKLREDIEAEVRAELAAAWGTPTVGHTAPVPTAGDAVESARRKGSFQGVVRAMMDTNQV